MVTFTASPLTAYTTIVVISLAAALILLSLEYLGLEFIGWLRRNRDSLAIVGGLVPTALIGVSLVAAYSVTAGEAWSADATLLSAFALLGVGLSYRHEVSQLRWSRSSVRARDARPGRAEPDPFVVSRSGASIDRGARALEVLRIAIGGVWLLNLLFILVPSADYWGSFASVASSFGASTPGGPGFASFVGANALFFAILIAVVTAYLAIAFLFGVTTRLACLVGTAASVVFLWTQFSTTFAFPGGTDVGPHPLYLAVYLALFVGGAGRYWSVDHRVWRLKVPLVTRAGRYVAAPAA